MAYDLTEDQIIGKIIDGSITEITNTAATSVAEEKFASCTGLTSVTLDNAVTVGTEAFANCSSLKSVSLASLKSLKQYTFVVCGALASLSLPACETVESYGLYSYSAMTEVSLPACKEAQAYAFQGMGDSVTSIQLPLCETVGNSAFYSTSLTSVSLPKCKTLGNNAFQNCNALLTADLPVCTSIGESAFQGLSGLTKVSMPACTDLGKWAFMSCSKLDDVSAGSCKSIGELAFGWDTSLKSIVLPSCVELAYPTFIGCTALASVELPVCKSLGQSCFNGCSLLTAVSIPHVKTVAEGVFVGCQALVTISFSDYIQSIGGAFANNTALTDIYVDRLEGAVSGAPWGASSTTTIHWRTPAAPPEPSTTPFQSFGISIASKTLSDTFSGMTTENIELKSSLAEAVNGQIFSFSIAGMTYNKASGLYTVRGDYDISKILGRDYSTSGLSINASAKDIFGGIVRDMDKLSSAHFSDFVPTGIKYPASDKSSYNAMETYGSVMQKLFGWTDIVPTTLVNVFERAGTVYAVQRGKEPNETVVITDDEIDYGTYSVSHKKMDLLYDSNKNYYITGDASDVEDASTDITQPAVYLSGQYTDNSGQQTLNYYYGLLKSESFNSSDGTVTSSTQYEYSKIYPPANLLSKQVSRTETKDLSDLPSLSAITSFPYKVTETITNTSELTNTMAVNGIDLIQSKEDVVCTQQGYNITDKDGTKENWTDTEEHETMTYYSDMGQGQWSVTVYKDGVFQNSQVVTGNPGCQASPYAIKESSTYQSRRGGRVRAKMAELSGRFTGNMSLNVSDLDTVERIRDAIEDLNGKTEETLSFSYLGKKFLDFTSTVTYKGNVYYLDSNSITVKPEGTRQQIIMVRWY